MIDIWAGLDDGRITRGELVDWIASERAAVAELEDLARPIRELTSDASLLEWFERSVLWFGCYGTEPEHFDNLTVEELADVFVAARGYWNLLAFKAHLENEDLAGMLMAAENVGDAKGALDATLFHPDVHKGQRQRARPTKALAKARGERGRRIERLIEFVEDGLGITEAVARVAAEFERSERTVWRDAEEVVSVEIPVSLRDRVDTVRGDRTWSEVLCGALEAACDAQAPAESVGNH